MLRIRQPSHRRPLGMVLILGATGLGSAHAGQRVTFNPIIGIGYGVTENVSYLDDPTATNSTDSTASLTLTLPVERQYRNGSWGLEYQGSATLYDANRALDNIASYLTSSYQVSVARRSELSISGVYVRTQEQAVPREKPDSATGDQLFLGERQELQSYGIGLGYALSISPVWSWSVTGSAGRTRSSAIDGYQDDTEGLARQDSISYSARTRIDRRRSERFSVGAEYAFNRYNLANEGPEDVHALALAWDRKIGRASSLSGGLGWYQRSREAAAGSSDTYRSEGVLGSIAYGRPLANGLSASVGVSIAPTSGGTLQGTSTNGTITAYLNGHRSERWSWQVGGYHSIRVSSDEATPTLEISSVTAAVESSLGRGVGVRLQASWANQSSDVEGYAEGEYYAASLGCVWYPLGRTRLAGG